MNEEFKIEIDITDDNKYYNIHACLRCIDGECGSVIDKLKEEYEGDEDINDYLCLIMIRLNINKNTRKIFMSDFYNNVTKLGRGLSHLNRKLKGGARAILCMILLKAYNGGIIKDEDKIQLEASGDLEDDIGNAKDMIGLVNYYKHLGFKITDENNLEDQLANLSVYMYGKVGDILDRCNDVKISPELRKIIRQIK